MSPGPGAAPCRTPLSAPLISLPPASSADTCLPVLMHGFKRQKMLWTVRASMSHVAVSHDIYAAVAACLLPQITGVLTDKFFSTWAPGQEADPGQRGVAARLESEVSLPLAGVQQSLTTQVAFWDHSATLSSAVMGLYTVPKARGLRNGSMCVAGRTQATGMWVGGLRELDVVEQPVRSNEGLEWPASFSVICHAPMSGRDPNCCDSGTAHGRWCGG